MSTKRSADTELTHDNWEDEDEPEEVGSFQKASEEVIKTRIIKSAKRRNPIRPEGEEKSNLFSNFGAAANKSASATFSFLNSSTTKDTTNFNGVDKKDTSNLFSAAPFASPKQTKNIFSTPPTTTCTSTNIFGSSSNDKIQTTTSPTHASGNWQKYCEKLKGLNESVAKWISQKVEENPLISLQPIFKDYEKYLDEIDSSPKLDNVVQGNSTPTPFANFKFKSSNTNKDQATSKTVDDIKDEKSLATSPNENALPNESETSPTSTQVTPTSSLKFQLPTNSKTSATSLFKFGSANNASGVPKPFSSLEFNNSPPKFSFGSKLAAAAPTTTSVVGGSASLSSPAFKRTEPETSKVENPSAEDTEDEPPKVEFQQVVEEDFIYNIRCKVFVKKGEQFGERGVGNLYLKQVKSSEKIQLIVRADTNLGNLLLNFILSKDVPTKRLGKKDVMLVTIPTPESQPPPVPILIRVKSPDDADKLLEVLEKHKK